MQVADDRVVSFHFTLTDAEGEIIDSSAGQPPLTYLHGRGHLISGIEQALAGKIAGDQFTLTLPPEEAYGPRQETLVEILSRTAFHGVPDVEVGMQFQAQYPNGPRVVTVTRVEGDEVTVDGNHPLAGETLTFEIEVTEVREATEEELAHGHVHDPDEGEEE